MSAKPSATAIWAMLAISLVWAGACRAADFEVIAKDVRFPEGPLWTDGALYYVEYGGHTIMRWNGSENEQVWRQDGCGPSALARTDQGLLVTCYDANTLVLVSMEGDTIRTYDRDKDGQPFIGPNDFAKDDKGGIYFSASGPWETRPIVGKIFYMPPDGEIEEVADNLHYANGLALSVDGKTLYCSETYGYRIIAFDVAEGGGLSNRREFRRLSEIAGEQGGALLGPDGLKTDSQGNLYIALYEGGQVLVANPDGKLLATLDPPAPLVSNVNFGADERVLFITGVLDGQNAPWPGEVYRAKNPVAAK